MSSPLADLIRPKKLDEVVGQKHLLGEGKPLRRIIDGGNIPNMIFYGPSGTGNYCREYQYVAAQIKRYVRLYGGY